MAKEIFVEGELVYLKSGGPLMTVIESDENNARCTWFDKNHQNHTNTFSQIILSRNEES